MVRNLIKYTLGLPILLIGTIVGVVAYLTFFVLNEPNPDIIGSIKEAWKPQK